MSMQDPIADMLTRIRNAQRMGIQLVRLSHSNFKNQILTVLKEEGFIHDFKIITEDNKKDLEISLKYYQGRPVIETITRVSKPSLRIYKGYSEIPTVQGGLGIAIISTPIGVMSDRSARARKVGGEVLCTVQ
jgi:small subunit ribosomal protein S8